MTIEEFEKLVQSHDLTYGYSDDHSVWRNGQNQYNKIVDEAKAFPIEDVRRIWNAMVDTRLVPHAREQFYWKDLTTKTD